MASALLEAIAPIVVRTSSRRAAGVKFPAASERFGVQLGGAIDPFFDALVGVREMMPGVRPPSPNSPALTRKLFDALFDSFCATVSRDVSAGMWNGVLGGGRSSD
jgi:hypothetical protein